MTYKEKWELDHPNEVFDVAHLCTYEAYGIPADDRCIPSIEYCSRCWNREIPEETIKPRYALTDDELKKFFGHPDPVGEPGEPGEPGLKIKIAYLCDKTACQNCSYPMCSHTTDITHAKNFKKMPITDKDNCVRYFEEETE